MQGKPASGSKVAARRFGNLIRGTLCILIAGEIGTVQAWWEPAGTYRAG